MKVESEANPTAAPYEKSLVPILSLSKTLAIPEKDSNLAAEKKSGDPTDKGLHEVPPPPHHHHHHHQVKLELDDKSKVSI
ncbi:hypothetical protein ACSBR1_005061 [Camellia fascicularis]